MSDSGSRPPPLRVLQFLPSVESASGGPVRSTLANCRAAHRADSALETVWISTRHGLDSSWESELQSSLPTGARLLLFPQIGMHTANVSPALLGWLWKHAEEFDLVVLRALFHPLNSAAAWMARRRDVPYLVVPHGTLSRWTFRHRRRRLKKLYFRLVERRTLEGARVVRYTSEAERLEAERLDFDTDGVVIPHPFEPRARDPDIQARDTDQVLFLSRLDPKKGIELLLDGFQSARNERPALRLVLAGSGPDSYVRSVRRAIRERGLEAAVAMPGFVVGDEKEALLRHSGVFVLPSVEENFGISVVEALDAGLPVVISREVDVAPHVEEYRAGRVIDPFPADVADAILTVLADEDRAEEMGRRGRQLVREQFAPDVVGPEVAGLYRKAGGGG